MKIVCFAGFPKGRAIFALLKVRSEQLLSPHLFAEQVLSVLYFVNFIMTLLVSK